MKKRRVLKLDTPAPLWTIPLGVVYSTFGVSEPTVRKYMRELEIPAYRNWLLPWKNMRTKAVDSRDLWKFHDARFFPRYIERLRERYPGEADSFTQDKLYPANEAELRDQYDWMYTASKFFETVKGKCDINQEELPDLLCCGAIPYYEEPNGAILIEDFWVNHILKPGHPTGDYIGYEGPLDLNKEITLV